MCGIYKRDTISWSSSYDTNWNKSFMKPFLLELMIHSDIFYSFSSWFQYLLQFDPLLKALLQYFSIAHRIRPILLTMAYKALYNLAPAYLFDLISHPFCPEFSILQPHWPSCSSYIYHFLFSPGFSHLLCPLPGTLCFYSTSANSRSFMSQLKYQAFPDPSS